MREILKKVPLHFAMGLLLVLLSSRSDACQSMEKKLFKKWAIQSFELNANLPANYKKAVTEALTKMTENATFEFSSDQTYQTSWSTGSVNGTWSLDKKAKTIQTIETGKKPSTIQIHQLKKKSMKLEMITEEGMTVVLFMTPVSGS